MAPKASKSTMKQSKLSFSASKSTAPTNKSTKADSSSKKSSSAPGSNIKIQNLDSSDEDEIYVDDIELAKSDTESDSEIEGAEEEEEEQETKELHRVVPIAENKTAAAKEKAAVTKTFPLILDTKVSEKKLETVQKEVVIDVESRPRLKVKNHAYDEISAETQKKMGNVKPIHGNASSRIDNILRVFDLSYEYGPCIGLSRLERWERAKKLGLDPPPEVHDILTTKEGLTKPKYSENVLAGRV